MYKDDFQAILELEDSMSTIVIGGREVRGVLNPIIDEESLKRRDAIPTKTFEFYCAYDAVRELVESGLEVEAMIEGMTYRLLRSVANDVTGQCRLEFSKRVNIDGQELRRRL